MSSAIFLPFRGLHDLKNDHNHHLSRRCTRAAAASCNLPHDTPTEHRRTPRRAQLVAPFDDVPVEYPPP